MRFSTMAVYELDRIMYVNDKGPAAAKGKTPFVVVEAGQKNIHYSASLSGVWRWTMDRPRR
jgi:hypothetical protein